ncbi:hypothetical protein, partial [Nocardia sp. NPDC003345]
MQFIEVVPEAIEPGQIAGGGTRVLPRGGDLGGYRGTYRVEAIRRDRRPQRAGILRARSDRRVSPAVSVPAV